MVLLVSFVLVWTANGLCFTLLTLRLKAKGYVASGVGMVTIGYFVGQLIGVAETCIRRIRYYRFSMNSIRRSGERQSRSLRRLGGTNGR